MAKFIFYLIGFISFIRVFVLVFQSALEQEESDKRYKAMLNHEKYEYAQPEYSPQYIQHMQMGKKVEKIRQERLKRERIEQELKNKGN